MKMETWPIQQKCCL